MTTSTEEQLPEHVRANREAWDRYAHGIGLFSVITATVTSYFIGGRQGQVSPIRSLEELGRLRTSGVITEGEFEAKKADLLGRV